MGKRLNRSVFWGCGQARAADASAHAKTAQPWPAPRGSGLGGHPSARTPMILGGEEEAERKGCFYTNLSSYCPNAETAKPRARATPSARRTRGAGGAGRPYVSTDAVGAQRSPLQDALGQALGADEGELGGPAAELKAGLRINWKMSAHIANILQYVPDIEYIEYDMTARACVQTQAQTRAAPTWQFQNWAPQVTRSETRRAVNPRVSKGKGHLSAYASGWRARREGWSGGEAVAADVLVVDKAVVRALRGVC